MKKIVLCSILAISILSCKKENNELKPENSTELKDENVVAEKMTISKITDSLKKGDYSKEFAKYSDDIINKLSENMTYVITLEESAREKDEEYFKEITNFENNVISLYWETCGTGGCVQHQKLQIKNNEVIDLGNGFNKLTESENLRLESVIKLKVKNFSHISGRSETKIKIKENGNYLITFSGLEEGEGESTGGSLEVTYESKDLKTFITDSVKVVKRA